MSDEQVYCCDGRYTAEQLVKKLTDQLNQAHDRQIDLEARLDSQKHTILEIGVENDRMKGLIGYYKAREKQLLLIIRRFLTLSLAHGLDTDYPKIIEDARKILKGEA